MRLDSDTVGRLELTIFLTWSNKSSTIQSTRRPCFTIASARSLGPKDGSNSPVELVPLEAEADLFFAVGFNQNELSFPFPLAVTPPRRGVSQCAFPAALRRSAVD